MKVWMVALDLEENNFKREIDGASPLVLSLSTGAAQQIPPVRAGAETTAFIRLLLAAPNSTASTMLPFP